jgi:hypothetical protein
MFRLAPPLAIFGIIVKLSMPQHSECDFRGTLSVAGTC